jgi:small-conductance mechanosensitive channel
MRGPLHDWVKAHDVQLFILPVSHEWIDTAIALVVALVLWRLVDAAVTRFYARRFVTRFIPRVSTYTGVTKSLSGVIIFFVLTLEILNIWRVNVAPALWSAGILGIIIGVGAQAIVRDVLTGTFFLFEDAFDVGDTVELTTSNGVIRGVVEAISLRELRIVDDRGYLVSVPHGSIVYVANATRLPQRLSIDFVVPLRGDISTLRERLTTIAQGAVATTGTAIEGLHVALAEVSQSTATFRIHFQVKRNEAHLAPPALREAIAAALQADGLLPSVDPRAAASPAQG